MKRCGTTDWRWGLSPTRRFSFGVYARGDCWERRGRPYDRNGYSLFSSAGRTTTAHRFAYEVAKGPVPQEMDVDHLCQHRWCVRPSHLEAVTHQENCRRGDAGLQLATRQRCKNGHLYSEANTRLDAAGARVCRTCQRVASKAFYHRRTHARS